MAEKEYFSFKNVKFFRYPKAKRPADRKYYKCVLYLHREVWKDSFGEIPKGCDVHHKDGNYNNNSIENLECTSRKEHCKRHSELAAIDPNNDRYKNSRFWHRSPYGRVWHSKLGKHAWKKRKPIKVLCSQCKKEFECHSTSKSSDRFCSNYCCTKSRRLSGKDNIEEKCCMCDRRFVTNKYKKRVTCSLKCQTLKRKLTLSKV